MIDQHEICCGTNKNGKGYKEKEFYECCNNDYLPVNTTMCCRDPNSGKEKVNVKRIRMNNLFKMTFSGTCIHS